MKPLTANRGLPFAVRLPNLDLKVSNGWLAPCISWITLRGFNSWFQLLDSSTSSTLFNKNIDYNRLARKIAIADLGGPVKEK